MTRNPVRYAIRLTTFNGETFDYGVVTFFGEAKAIALAAETHAMRHGDKPIHTVEIREATVPHPTDTGYAVDPEDLLDRMEW